MKCVLGEGHSGHPMERDLFSWVAQGTRVPQDPFPKQESLPQPHPSQTPTSPPWTPAPDSCYLCPISPRQIFLK
jgi:hypothetical protein